MFPYSKEIELLLSNPFTMGKIIEDTVNNKLLHPISIECNKKIINNSNIAVYNSSAPPLEKSDQWYTNSNYMNPRDDYKFGDFTYTNQYKTVTVFIDATIKTLHKLNVASTFNKIRNIPKEIFQSIVGKIYNDVIYEENASRYNISMHRLLNGNTDSTSMIDMILYDENGEILLITHIDSGGANDEEYNVGSATATLSDYLKKNNITTKKTSICIIYSKLFENLLLQIHDTTDNTYTKFAFTSYDPTNKNSKNTATTTQSSYMYNMLHYGNWYLCKVDSILDLTPYTSILVDSSQHIKTHNHNYSKILVDTYSNLRCSKKKVDLLFTRGDKTFHIRQPELNLVNEETFVSIFNLVADGYMCYVIDIIEKRVQRRTSIKGYNNALLHPVNGIEYDKVSFHAINCHLYYPHGDNEHDDYLTIEFNHYMDRRVTSLNTPFYGDDRVMYDKLQPTTNIQICSLNFEYSHEIYEEVIKFTCPCLSVSERMIYNSDNANDPTIDYQVERCSGQILNEMKNLIDDTNHERILTDSKFDAIIALNKKMRYYSNVLDAIHDIQNRINRYLIEYLSSNYRDYTFGSYSKWIDEQIHEISHNKELMDSMCMIEGPAYDKIAIMNIENFVSEINYYGADNNYNIQCIKVYDDTLISQQQSAEDD